MGSFIATECKFKNENRTESTYNTTNIPHIPQYMHKYDRVGRSGSIHWPRIGAYLHTSCIHITLTKIYIHTYTYPKHMPIPTFDSSIHLVNVVRPFDNERFLLPPILVVCVSHL